MDNVAVFTEYAQSDVWTTPINSCPPLLAPYWRRPAETLLGRDLMYDEISPRPACDRYSLTAVPEALTISMLPPWPTWMDS